MTGQQRRQYFLVVGVLLCALSSIPLVRGGRCVASAYASRSWPAVQGRIERSATYDRLGRFGTVTWPAIVFRYEVRGRTYAGTRVGWWFAGPTDQGARDLVARYPEGREVGVHYDADRPQEAVLEADVTPWAFEDLPFGVGGLLAGAGLIVWQRRLARRAAPATA
jgi:hypothetical protein